ncbi:MAG: hypothetical protein KC457_33880, partial [Myxococcales bacterium]|nr:hypothetical protein [Myxococcales bacterium]
RCFGCGFLRIEAHWLRLRRRLFGRVEAQWSLGFDAGLVAVARASFGIALAFDLFALMFGEFGVAHPSEVAARAAHAIIHGKYAQLYWGGAIVTGHLVPLALLAIAVIADAAVFGALAGLLALVGLYAYEHAFVMAPQEVPNS